MNKPRRFFKQSNKTVSVNHEIKNSSQVIRTGAWYTKVWRLIKGRMQKSV